MTNIRLCYQTLVFGDIDIHLCTLRDRQQFHDPHGVAEKLGISSATWPVFGVLWPSGQVLAQFMDNFDTRAKSILEVGCGMALPSLLLNAKNADITATDRHPEAKGFLERNTTLNNDTSIAFERTDWADVNDHLGRFDLIIGSDLLYEDEHVDLLANFLNTHANPVSEIILVDPGRGRKTRLAKAMAVFGYTCCYENLPADAGANGRFEGYIMRLAR